MDRNGLHGPSGRKGRVKGERVERGRKLSKLGPKYIYSLLVPTKCTEPNPASSAEASLGARCYATGAGRW